MRKTMITERYTNVSSIISNRNDAIKEKINNKRKNTEEAMMLLTDKIEYFKYDSSNMLMISRYAYIVQFLKNNFGEFDEAPIKKYLTKNGIFSKDTIKTLTCVCYFICSLFFCMLILYVLKEYTDANMVLRIFVSTIVGAVFGTVAIGLCGALATSKFRPYKIHKDYK